MSFLFNLPNPSSCTDSGAYSASKRNEYQKQNKMFLNVGQAIVLEGYKGRIVSIVTVLRG
jgi:hypothetical protein